MKTQYRILLAIITVTNLALTGCSEDVRNKKMSGTPEDADIQMIANSKQLTDEEKRLFVAYTVRAKLGTIWGKRNSSESRTVGEIIAEERKRQADQAIEDAEKHKLAAAAAAEEARIDSLLRKSIDVAVYKKSYEEATFGGSLTLGLVFRNSGAKDIRAFKGSVLLRDLFDEDLDEFSFSYDEGIAAGKVIKWVGSKGVNPFSGSPSKLKTIELSNMKTIWRPAKVIFVDGTSLEQRKEVPTPID